MANKQALRELQTRLAERLQQARSRADTARWLAVECAGQGLLLPLGEAGEIFPMGPVLAVPHTQPWFVGVANLRGRLLPVMDHSEPCLRAIVRIAAASLPELASVSAQAPICSPLASGTTYFFF